MMAKPRFWQRRVMASRMTIRQHRPWPITLAWMVMGIGLGGAVAMWTYDMGRSLAFGSKVDPKIQIAELTTQLDELRAERDELARNANTSDSKQNIERSMQKQMVEQVQTLTADNLKLKDDLAFFESLMPNATGPVGISVQRVSADLLSPNQLRYRILIMQGGKGDHDFVGELQLNVSLAQNGKPVMMVFPDAKLGEAGKLKLSFRHYQRLEGVISLPDGVTVRAVQAKVMERGQQRAQRSINL
jgi:hypothetical protein